MREIRRVAPQVVELAVHCRRRGDHAELQFAAQRVRDDRINRAPDFLGVLVERELVEHEFAE